MSISAFGDSSFRDLLVAEWGPYGCLSQEQLELLEAHYKRLIQWNQVLNLTRIRRLEDVVRLHYCESLFLGSVLPEGSLSIADVGSGAGFPGIPVAVLRPECSLALIESHRRKAVFLEESCTDIRNATVITGRAEASPIRSDWLVSRAVEAKFVLSRFCDRKIALLTSGSEAASLSRPASQVLRVPWGQDRVVAIVPRGTSKC